MPTVAVNFAFAPTFTVSSEGLTETVTAETVIVVDFDTELLATEVAVTVTARSDAGGVSGAV